MIEVRWKRGSSVFKGPSKDVRWWFVPSGVSVQHLFHLCNKTGAVEGHHKGRALLVVGHLDVTRGGYVAGASYCCKGERIAGAS
eukprot:507742-Pelagomonas_calceolata.AAC.4